MYQDPWILGRTHTKVGEFNVDVLKLLFFIKYLAFNYTNTYEKQTCTDSLI